MNDSWDHVPAWAAEFPNDNPALHEGVSWVCLSVCGPVKPIARPRATSRSPAPVAPTPVHSTSAVVAAPSASAVTPLEVAPETVFTDPVSDAPPPDLVLDAAPANLPEKHLPADPIPEVLPADPIPEERLPASVLGVLLERLDFELTPTSEGVLAEVPTDEPLEVLDLDASDLEGDGASRASEAEACPPEPFVFDGGLDSGAPEGVVELVREEVVGPALERPERNESALAVLVDAAVPVDAAASASDAAGAPASDPPQVEAFAAFVGALVEVLLVSGATRAAAVVPSLLDGVEGDPGALDSESQRMLVAARIAEDADGRIRLSTSFLATAQAWRDVLSGKTNDLSACGTSTLDGWAGELLKALGVGRDGKMDVRRELRRRGVAAFGMLLAA